MNRTEYPRELKPFLDEEGRVRQWPARHKTQRMAAALLAQRFEPGREYAEREVNERLMDGHTFGDWALLRRRLVDWGFMTREPGGVRYRLLPDSAERIARELDPAPRTR